LQKSRTHTACGKREVIVQIEHLPAGASSDEVVQVLERDGCAVIDRVFGPDAMDALEAELRPWIEATPFGADETSGACTRRTGGLVARSSRSHQLIMHPLVLASAERMLRRATAFQLHLTQVISLHPGQSSQMIHRDQWGFDFFPFPNGHEVMCNTIWALTDFTEANGATRVIPGSHKLPDGQVFAESDTIPAEMERGSVLIYTGSLYHGGGTNCTQGVRAGVNVTYSAAWLRQEENQYLTVPHELARTLPVELLRLIGYRLGAVGLGYLDDLRDPIEAVRPDLKSRGFGELSELDARLERMRPAPA
jgi:hypothetical protein